MARCLIAVCAGVIIGIGCPSTLRHHSRNPSTLPRAANRRPATPGGAGTPTISPPPAPLQNRTFLLWFDNGRELIVEKLAKLIKNMTRKWGFIEISPEIRQQFPKNRRGNGDKYPANPPL